MSKPTNRLGKGLSAIISPRSGSPIDRPHAMHPGVHPPAPSSDGIRMLTAGSIRPNPNQPRSHFDERSLQELAESIRLSGMLQPVLVRPAANGEGFELIAGERRWRAAQLAGLQTIPAIVRALSDSQSLEIALIENLQREDLNPIERAVAYQRYLDSFGGSADDLAGKLAESRANVTNYLRLLKLSLEIQRMLGAGEIGMGQARALAGVSDPQRQLALARLAVRRNLSARQVEALVKNAVSPPEAPPAHEHRAASRHQTDVEQALSRGLGIPVRLKPGRRKNSGRVVIAYNSLEEFDRIAERLGASATLE